MAKKKAKTKSKPAKKVSSRTKINQSGSGSVATRRGIAAGAGGIAIKGNVYGDVSLNNSTPSLHWLRPSAPRPSKPMIGRRDELEKIKALIKPGSKTAITATVHGTPGVGKTLLAEHLAADLDSQFAGGVLFQRLGMEFRDSILCNPILKHWADFAFGGNAGENFQPVPDEVRALLSQQPDLLVVLDDIWDVKAVRPLLEALPNQACIVATTRSQKIARELHGEVYPLDVLNPDDALALLHARITEADGTDDPLLKELAAGLGFHAQALDIAGGNLARLPRKRWTSAVQEMTRQVKEGTGFGELQLPGDEETESRVEAALAFSYNDLKPETQQRFRWLGVFAPDGSFRTEAAAALWKCTVEQAEGQLTVFVELGLLNRQEQPNQGTRWQQHALLRAYALALLHREDEKNEAHALHAQFYNKLMEEADDQQIYYVMLPEYPQVRYAFEWAIQNDLNLAQSLAGNTAKLQATFYLVRESYEWAQKLVAGAQQGTAEALASAQLTLGNALARLANLPDEDRRQRLLEALHAYDEALKHYRPDTAPLAYAATQNNRGTVLSDLAASPDEDRRQRLLEALHAYDEALKFHRPDTAPLAYAMTQANLALLYVDLSSFPEENRKDQLQKALKSTVTALSIFVQVGHEPYAQHTARQLKWISEEAGPSFLELWKKLELGQMPDWLKG